MTRISVVLNVSGHEPWIRQCLACVRWADEVVVTDMGADEETVAACDAVGARRVPVPRTDTVEPARHAGVAAARGEWVLVLDPDELVPRSLALRLQEIARNDEADVVAMSWRNHLLGAEIRHTGWGMHPDRHSRFFRRGALQFRDEIHSTPVLAAGARHVVLDAVEGLAVVHFNYTGVSSYLQKLDRYTSAEARQLTGARSGAWAVRQAVRESWRRYVSYRGFRDGWRGAVLSVLQGVYVLVTWAKAKEAEGGGEAAILKAYEQVAAEVVAGHRSQT